MIKNKNIAIIADIHLGLRQAASKCHDTHIEWAQWMKTELLKKNITDIIISGDFFHYRDEINVNTISIANKILNIWSGFNILMLTGNHDCYFKDNSKVNSLSAFKGRKDVAIVDEYMQFELHGKKINIIPWGTNMKDVLLGDINFGHFDIMSFKLNFSTLCSHGVDPKELNEKAKLTFTGHFHIRQEVKYSDGSTIIYTGNPFQMDFGDVDDKKGFYILNLETLEYKFIENKISPKFYYIKDNYKSFKHIKNNHIKLHLSERALLKELKNNGIDVNDSKYDVNLEIVKMIDDIRLYFKNNGVEDLIIEKDIIKQQQVSKTSVNSSTKLEVKDILKEMCDSINFDFKNELYKKLETLYDK